MAEKKEGEKEKKEGDGVIRAVYKVNLHCPECAREIKKPLGRIKGVRKVETDLETSKVTVEGAIDGKKVKEFIEKKSKKKVEMLSVEVKKDEPEKKETKEKVTTTVIKVQMHCTKCEYDLKRQLLKYKGVQGVKIDSTAQTCTVESTVESEKLVRYVQKKFTHKHVEIVPPKKEKKEKAKEKEKKVEVKIEEVKEVVAVEKEEPAKEEKPKEEKKEEWKYWGEKGAPYFVHCTHGYELLSDENPNACIVM